MRVLHTTFWKEGMNASCLVETKDVSTASVLWRSDQTVLKKRSPLIFFPFDSSDFKELFHKKVILTDENQCQFSPLTGFVGSYPL